MNSFLARCLCVHVSYMTDRWITKTSSYYFITFSWLTFRHFHIKLFKKTRPELLDNNKQDISSSVWKRWICTVLEVTVSLSEHYRPGKSLTTPMIPRCCTTSSVFDRLPSALITLLTVPLIRCSCHRSRWMSVWVLTSVSCPLCQSQQSWRGGRPEEEAVQRRARQTFCGGSSLHGSGGGRDQPLQGRQGQRWDWRTPDCVLLFILSTVPALTSSRAGVVQVWWQECATLQSWKKFSDLYWSL